MTGLFVRIQRDGGQFENVEVEEMTDSELDRFIKMKMETEKEYGWNWVKVLIKWIRDNPQGSLS